MHSGELSEQNEYVTEAAGLSVWRSSGGLALCMRLRARAAQIICVRTVSNDFE